MLSLNKVLMKNVGFSRPLNIWRCTDSSNIRSNQKEEKKKRKTREKLSSRKLTDNIPNWGFKNWAFQSGDLGLGIGDLEFGNRGIGGRINSWIIPFVV